MEKIVVVYQIGDECTYSAAQTVALEYDSSEAFIVDFETWAVTLIDDANGNDDYPHGTLQIGKHEFDIMDFRYKNSDNEWQLDMPEIYTLEEWFNAEKVN